MVVYRIDVADELDFDPPPIGGFQRLVFVADVVLLLQFRKVGLVGEDILEKAQFPDPLSEELFVEKPNSSIKNGLTSTTIPVSASRIKMPSLADSKSRR